MADPAATPPKPFAAVFNDELTHLGKPDRNNLIGLCFSGGGIRSATFNLGILAVLEKRKIIDKVDYLSTVSGGGYLGAYFLGCHAHGKSAGEENESGLDHLRRFGNYLSLDNGFFSLDTWTGIMVWLRNTTLLQIFLMCVLAAVLLLPRLWAALAWEIIPDNPGEPGWISAAPWFGCGEIVGLLMFGVVTWFICSLLRRSWFLALSGIPAKGAWNKELWSVVLLGILAGVPLARTIYKVVNLDTTRPEIHAGLAFAALFALTIAAASWFLSRFSLNAVRLHKGADTREPGDAIVPWVAALAAGAGMFGLTYFAYAVLGNWAIDIFLLKNTPGDGFAGGPWHFLLWAIPGLLAALSCSLTLMLGAAGRALPDMVREGWSRLAACLMLACLGFVAVGVIGIYGPLVIWRVADSAGKWVAAAGGLGAIAGGLAGLIFARGPETKGKGALQATQSSGLKEIMAQMAPYFFVLFIVTGLSFGMNAVFAHQVLSTTQQIPFAKFNVNGSSVFAPPASLQDWYYNLLPGTGWPDPKTLLALHWTFLGLTSDPLTLAELLLALLAVAAFLAWRVDINSFSMNPFYRNRLVRCFLGASRYASEKRGALTERNPSPVTGFDLDDDIQMLDLARIIDKNPPGYFKNARKLPIPIINTALNAVGGQDAVMGERRAVSLFFTPFHVYSDITGGRAISEYSLGDRPGDVNLGTLVATSGAAANPNMGFHTSAPIAFLLTFFNVRLGWWVRNPKLDPGKNSPFGLLYTFRELTGTAGDNDRRLNLSDGGHFENLGLYELIRRQCRYIIVGDGEQDDNYVFGSLGSAIRRCRDDFGAEIRIDVSHIQPTEPAGPCGIHHAFGTITYKDGTTGDIVYMKSSYTGKEPLYDLHQYKLQHEEFPHESTADQFFSESQFESYRQLGKIVAQEALEAAGHQFFALVAPQS